MELQYLGHSGFRISHNGVEILIDPYFTKDKKRITEPKIDPRTLNPDFIFITHEHFDHCDVEIIKMLTRKKHTKIVGPPPIERKLGMKIIKMRPGNQLSFEKFMVRALPAYHKQSEFPIGYLFDLDGIRIYHAGDTIYNSELAKINTDVAILPIGGTYTMNIDDALKLAEDLHPRIIIPMHFDTFEDIKADPLEFAKLSDKVVVLKEGEIMEVNK